MDIIRHVQHDSEGTWTPSPGSIYYLLSELSSAGEIQEVGSAGKGEKRYIATPLGLQHAAASAATLRSEMRRIIGALALALPQDETARLLLRVCRLVLEAPSSRRGVSELLADCAGKLAKLA
jgi:DNA-binding PadR family transcriptional regulator